ncbi:hypothetical protein AB0K51_19505 [Kitasatospora sp. NPDC049285]|uniref:hypothetical protein n=1 Tax=Kitasatospora sp. NPDC049285 TaxID=3157096 RepID=UPI003429A585
MTSTIATAAYREVVLDAACQYVRGTGFDVAIRQMRCRCYYLMAMADPNSPSDHAAILQLTQAAGRLAISASSDTDTLSNVVAVIAEPMCSSRELPPGWPV